MVMELEKFKSYQQLLLSQVYSQHLKKNEEDTKTWEQYRDSHKKIVEGLETLALDLAVNCMVPLGKRAMMKGKLTHTNEILICIGDGYFVKYSSHQAVALCNRRIKHAEEMLEKLGKEKKLFEVRQLLPKSCGAFEYNDSKDVIEHWDEKKLEDWRVEHRKKEKEYRQRLIELKNQKKKEIKSEDDLFKRLDELELEEELADELNRLEDEKQNINKIFSNTNEDDGDDNDDDDDDDDDDGEGGDDHDHDHHDEELTEDDQKEQKEEKEYEEHKTNILSNKIKEIGEFNVNINISLEGTKLNVSNPVNEHEKSKVISKSPENIKAPVIHNKINGKFEVSIVKEDETGRPSSPLSPIYFEKVKSSGKRVSFGEPQFLQMESNSDLDSDVEHLNEIDKKKVKKDILNHNVDNDNDDIIKINFKHTDTKSCISEESDNRITSPQDIYKVFSKPKSILKRSLSYTKRNNATVDETFQENININKSTYNMVVQDIQERSVEKSSMESNEPVNKKRPISRFKLERTQKLKN